MSVELPGYCVLFVLVHFKECLLGAGALTNVAAISEQDTIAADGRRVLLVLGVVEQQYRANSLYLLVELRLESPARSKHSLISCLEVLGLRGTNARNKPKEFLVCHCVLLVRVVVRVPMYPARPITLVSRRNLMPVGVVPRRISGSLDIIFTWP